MAQIKFIKADDVSAWLDELAAEHKVLAPRYEGDALVFRSFDKEKEICLDRQATASPKKSVFPQSEELVKFTYTKDPEDPSKVLVEAQEMIPEGTTVVFGGRPCDARGFTMFDRVYLEGKKKDIYYKTRRENTCFITLACEKAEGTCFCNWVGSGPADTTGSDVLMTPVSGGYLLQSVSEKGEKLLSSALLSDGAGKEKEAEKFHEEAEKTLSEAPDLSIAPEKLLEVFNNMDFWDEVSSKCLSCGACTYLCPTCYCFNITDEEYGNQGARIRSWDNCMSAMFTMEASGHNPRPTKAHRLKNRVGHKFSYYPDLHDGVISCCGCGRCIKSCPACVDIREIVMKAVNYEPAAVKEGADDK
jgi:ferredoxin